MPRYARIDYPNLLQHVIVRGIQRSNIFLDDKDREDFVERLDVLLKDTGTYCYAWALLDNHFHLLLRPEATSLANFMRRLLTGYYGLNTEDLIYPNPTKREKLSRPNR